MSAFIDTYRDRFGVELVCRTLEVSASAYYQRRTGERCARRVEDERLLAKMRTIFAEHYECYGVRRMHVALLRAGERVGRDRVARLMRQAGLKGAKRRGTSWRTTIPDPAAEQRPDLVNRDFAAPAPDRLWVRDFTYLRTWEGRVFFAFIIDCPHARSSAGSSPRTCAATSSWTLRMALSTRQPGADFTLRGALG